MTVCIATKANDGKSLILAADQMATMMHIVREAESAHKILPLTETIYLLVAGSEFSAKEIYKAVLARADEIDTVESATEIVKSEFLVARLIDVQSRYLSPRGLDIQSYLQAQQSLDRNIVGLIDNQMLNHPFDVGIIVAGINPDGVAKIFEIGDPGIFGEHDVFTSIGSGASHATNSILARSYQPSQTETQGVYTVFEAKKRSEVAPGVGLNTDLILLNHAGAKVYGDDELAILNDFYTKYTQDEQKTLESLLQKEFNDISKGIKKEK